MRLKQATRTGEAKMNLPKYTICKRLSDGKFTVNKKRKIIGVFSTKEDAEIWVSAIVADDQWLAANRD
jgi:hypothetical protein